MKTSKKSGHRAQSAPVRHRAATRDVLGAPARRTKIDPRWARHYRHLVELRDFFLLQKGLLSEDANEQHPAFSEHPADAATDSFDRDIALGLLSSDQNALFEIEAALRRIESGAYGVCELTGKRIPSERLAAIPWTQYSLEAEKQLEAQGAVNRARLGRNAPLFDKASPNSEADEDETE